jgi:hypothetical protein
VEYGVAIVEGSRHLARARAFVAGLMTGRGHRDLVRDGFAPAPAG